MDQEWIEWLRLLLNVFLRAIPGVDIVLVLMLLVEAENQINPRSEVGRHLITLEH